MRFHRLELENLNSLAGRQVIDFDAELGDAGLFLICGPTGAGKTTLMDAISLALFGVTPRLNDRRGTASADPRTAMTHGTAHVEVQLEFSVLDESGARIRRRASWSCRRKRTRGKSSAERALAAPVRTLELWRDGGWEPVVSSEIQKHYDEPFARALRGLSSEDFQRSVLLAQGRIDALLVADDKQRGELLARLTGADRYQQLGERAARIATCHRSRLEVLGAVPLGLGDEPVDDEAIEAVRRAEAEAEEVLGRAKARADALVRAEHWLAEQARLTGLLGESEARLAEARAARAEAEPALARLADYERWAPILARDDEVRLRGERLEGLTKRRAELDAQAEKARRDAADASTALARHAAASWDGAVEAWRAAVQDRELARSDLERAQAQARERADDLREARAHFERCARDLGQAGRALREACAAVAGELAALGDPAFTPPDRDDGPSSAADPAGSLVDERAALHRALGPWQALTAQWPAGLDSALTGLAEAWDDAPASESPSGERPEPGIAARFERLEPPPGAVAGLERAATELSALRARLKARLAALAEAARAGESCAAWAERVERAEIKRAERRAHLEAVRARSDERDRALERARAHEADLERAVASARTIHALSQHRANLVAGEPCPLCGAREHPLVDAGAAEDYDARIFAELEALQARAEQAAAAAQAASQAHAEVQRELATLEGELAGLDQAAAEARVELVRARAHFDELRSSAECGGSGDAAARDLAAATARLSDLGARLDRLSAAWDRLVAAASTWSPRLEPLRLAGQRGAHAARLASAAQARCAEQLERSEQAGRRMQTAVEGLAERWLAAAEPLGALDDGQRALDPAGVQALWTKRVDAVAAARARITASAQRLEGELSQLESSRQRTADELAAALAELDRARAERERALVEAGIDEARLASARLEPELRRALAEQRRSLDEALAHAHAAVKAHTESLASHLAGQPAEADLEGGLERVREDLAAARAELERALEARDHARDARVTRERLRAERERLARERERWQGLAAPWLRLDALIGTNRGEAFQRFAMQLEFGRLLAAANHHLVRLAPRYTLAQPAGTDKPSLDFELSDAWQAGERRSWRNLSGGERFLVSLALALGLSDLRSTQLPLETLLLDEGFGTLDAQSLELALAALEQLRAGGRQVGVISHVAALRERIPARIVVDPVAPGRAKVRVERG